MFDQEVSMIKFKKMVQLPKLKSVELLINDIRMKTLIHQYFQLPFVIDGYKVLHVSKYDTRESYPSSKWHHDGCGTRIKVFIYMDDVSENVATQIAASTQNVVHFFGGKANSGVYYDDNFMEKNFVIHRMTGPKYGGFIFDTNVLHRGSLDSLQSRNTIVIDSLALQKYKFAKGSYFSCPERVRYDTHVTWNGH